MSTELITTPIPTEIDTTRIAPLGQDIIDRCNALSIIDSQDKANDAGDVIKLAAKVKGTILAELDPLRVTTHTAWKNVCALINKHTAFEEHTKQLGARVARYITAEREKVETERRRLEAEARAEAERAAQAERDRLMEQAAEMERQGLDRAAERAMAQAERVEAAPIQVQAPYVPPAPKVESMTTRDNWSAKLIDLSLVPAEYLMFDQKAADAFARATKGAKQVPGIEFVNNPVSVNLGR